MAGLEDDGTMDWVRGVEPAAQESPAEEADTEAPDELEEETPEVSDGEEADDEQAHAGEESPPEGEIPPADAEEDDVFEFDADHPFFTKYGGDPDKALKALEEAQSLIGRQANEVGEARKAQEEMAERLARIEAGVTANQPYQAAWPDEDDDEDVQVQMYSALANEAYLRKDADTFGQAVEAWKEIDPFGASNMVNEVRIQQALGARDVQPAPVQGDLEAEMGKVLEQYPEAPQYAEAVGAESQKYPTLRMLMESGNSLEKAQAFKELYLIVRNRQTDDTSADAKKKVAVRMSEEARLARQNAKVVSGGKAVTVSDKESPTEAANRRLMELTGQIEDKDGKKHTLRV
jgi:hypothetical protein